MILNTLEFLIFLKNMDAKGKHKEYAKIRRLKLQYELFQSNRKKSNN